MDLAATITKTTGPARFQAVVLQGTLAGVLANSGWCPALDAWAHLLKEFAADKRYLDHRQSACDSLLAAGSHVLKLSPWLWHSIISLLQDEEDCVREPTASHVATLLGADQAGLPGDVVPWRALELAFDELTSLAETLGTAPVQKCLLGLASPESVLDHSAAHRLYEPLDESRFSNRVLQYKLAAESLQKLAGSIDDADLVALIARLEHVCDSITATEVDRHMWSNRAIFKEAFGVTSTMAVAARFGKLDAGQRQLVESSLLKLESANTLFGTLGAAVQSCRTALME